MEASGHFVARNPLDAINMSVHTVNIAELQFNFSTNSTASISNRLIVYSALNVITILIGIIVNIIVIAAYKFGDRKVSNNINNINFVNMNNLNVMNNLSINSSNNSNLNKLISNLNESIKGEGLSPNLKKSQTRNQSTKQLQLQPNLTQKNEKLKRPETNELQKLQISNPIQRRNTAEYQQRQRMKSGSFTQNNLITTMVSRHRRTVCSYFILSLGCCDLLICFFNMPFNLLVESGYFDLKLREIFADSAHSDIWCKSAYFLGQIPIVLEIEILLTIAIDRYSSVFHPIKFYFFDRNKSKLTLIAQILLSCLLSLPNLLFFSSFNTQQKQSIQTKPNTALYSLANYCHVKQEMSTHFVYYQAILFTLFLINLAFIIIFYAKVYNHIYKVSRNQRFESIASGGSINSSMLLATNFSRLNSTSVATQSENSIKLSRSLKKEPNFFSYYWSKYVLKRGSRSSRRSIRRKDIELSTNLNNIEEFEGNEDEEDEPKVDEKREEKNLIKPKQNHSNDYLSAESKYKKSKSFNEVITSLKLTSKKYSAKSNENQLFLCPPKLDELRRASCPSAIGDERNFKSKVEINESGSIIEENRKTPTEKTKNFLIIPILNTATANSSNHNIIKARVKLNKRIRTCSSRSNEVNLSNKLPNSVINRFRRFSENQNSLYSRSSSSNQNYLFDYPYGNVASPANALLFRRHTTRIFQHGKTARILGVATLAFTLTWTPYWFHTFIDLTKKTYDYDVESKSSIRQFRNEETSSDLGSFVLDKFIKNSFYLNYVLNPLFYSFVNQRFRKNVYFLFNVLFKIILKCCCCLCYFESAKKRSIRKNVPEKLVYKKALIKTDQ